MINKLLTITLTLALFVNGAVYMALNDMKRRTCASNEAFTVLASALQPARSR